MKKWLAFLAVLAGCLWSQLSFAGVYAYIMNSGSYNISVIDTSDNTVSATIPLSPGSMPSGVAVHPNGTRVYVTNYWDNNVSVIDTATNTVVNSPITVGVHPDGVAALPDGTRLYVANSGSNTVSVIDTTKNPPEVIGSPIPVGPSPHGVAVLPDGSQVYVANFTGGSVSVIRTSDNTVMATMPMPGDTPYPEGVAAHPDGTRVYVTNGNTNTVAVIDTTKNPPEVIGSPIPVGLWPGAVAINPDGTRVYVANSAYDDSTVSVIDTATNTVVGDPILLPAHSMPAGVDFLPDGTRVYVPLVNSPDKVAVIDTTKNPPEVVKTIGVGTWPGALGKFIVTTPSPTNPTGTGAATPPMVEAEETTLLTVTVTPGTYPTSTGLAVTCDLSSIGGSATQAFYDNGTDGDVTAGDHVFSYTAPIDFNTPDGAKSLPCTITDAEARTGSASIELFTYHDFSECYMTGGGTLWGPFAPPLPPGKTVFVNYSMLLSCPEVMGIVTDYAGPVPPEPNLLTVSWGGSNRFALKGPVKIQCGTDLPPWLTYVKGIGMGTWNWMPGYMVEFEFWDNLMTGQRDMAYIHITQISSGKVMLSAQGSLVAGGYAAHCPMVRAVQY